MPVIPGSNAAASPTLQQIITELRANPEFIPTLGTTGFSQYPALTIANDVMQRILSENIPWKWNRKYSPRFLTNSLQQDYVSNITDIAWLEGGWRVDINNSTNNGNLAPKPIFSNESVRDLDMTAYQGVPFNISFVPNSLAFLGQWQAETPYLCGYGVAQIPITPIQQFMDVNGNILFIDSTVLNLNINSPGFSTNGGNVPLPPNSPYGTSGSVQPTAPPNAPAGMTVQDGTVVWTVADPYGVAIRVSPLPAFSGLDWLMWVVYQSTPPNFINLQQTIAPIPPRFSYLFRQGFRAFLYEYAGSPKAKEAYELWEQKLMVAIQSEDRQREDCVFYPSESLMGGGAYDNQLSIGAAYPFGGYPGAGW